MSRIDDGAMEGPAGFEAGRALWRRCRGAEMPNNEVERFLDLAGLADGLLDDEDEHDRVAALLIADPAAAADVAAARAIATGGIAMPSGLERIIQRAVAIVDKAADERPVIPLRPQPTGHRVLQGVAQWGGLAAAVAFAGWLGFAMGSGASLTLTQPGEQTQIGDESFLPELLDPSTGFLREFVEGRQT
jgi:anti-sigma factor RsiW